jgi:hypothetical protein
MDSSRMIGIALMIAVMIMPALCPKPDCAIAQEPDGQSPLNKKLVPGKKDGPPAKSDLKALDEKAILALATKGGDLQKSLPFSAVTAKVDGLEIAPESIKVPVNKRVVMVVVKCKSKVGWFITNTAEQPIEYLQVADQPYVMVFPNAVDETIDVYAFTAVDGTPAIVRSSIIVGTGKAKVPAGPVSMDGPAMDGPGPAGKPLPAGSRIHFTIIHDEIAEKANPRLADLVTSNDIIAGLRDRGHFRWVMGKVVDVAQIRAKGFDAFMQKVGSLPMFIVQDESGIVVDYRALTGTPASILAYIDKLAPQK